MAARPDWDIGGDRSGAFPRIGSREPLDEQQPAGMGRILGKRGTCAARGSAAKGEKRTRKRGERNHGEHGGGPWRGGVQQRTQREHGCRRGKAPAKTPDEEAFGGECAHKRAPRRIAWQRHVGYYTKFQPLMLCPKSAGKMI